MLLIAYLYLDAPSIVKTVELRKMNSTKCAQERNEQINKGKMCAEKPPGVSIADVCRVSFGDISEISLHSTSK